MAAPTVANHNTKTVFRYIDVLGDPQLHGEAVIREFEAALADSVCVTCVCLCVYVCGNVRVFFLKNVSITYNKSLHMNVKYV